MVLLSSFGYIWYSWENCSVSHWYTNMHLKVCFPGNLICPPQRVCFKVQRVVDIIHAEKKYWRGSTVYILCNWVSLHFPKLANSLLYGHFCQIFARWMAFVFRKIGWMLTGRRDNNYKVIDLSSKKNIGPFLKNWTKKRNLNWLLFAVSSFRIFNRLEFRDLSEVWTQGSLYTCDTFFLLSLKD